jgi:hypothetical protein
MTSPQETAQDRHCGRLSRQQLNEAADAEVHSHAGERDRRRIGLPHDAPRSHAEPRGCGPAGLGAPDMKARPHGAFPARN